MTELNSPAVLDALAGLVGDLDGIAAANREGWSIAEPIHAVALDRLRTIAAACGVDWDEVLDRHDAQDAAAE